MTMRVRLVSSCPFAGGAARAAFRLHETLGSVGVDSRWIDADGPGAPERPDVTRLVRPDRRKRSLWTRLTGRGDLRRRQPPFVGAHTYATWPEGWGGPEVFAGAGAGFGDAVAEVTHLHWVGDFLDWRATLPALAARGPLVWTLHDLHPTQGVWHYDPDADERNAERDRLDARAREIKRAALAEVPSERLVFVAPSRWMAERCRASELTGRFAVEHIPYGVDSEVFYPVDKMAARTALGLTPGVAVVGFVADSLVDRRKGMAVLQAAMERLAPTRALALVTVGNGQPAAPAGAELARLGPVREDRLLRLFYSACDVFVCPSLQDNLPNTVLEAMACGTAVVGSATGGIPDMVAEGETGWLTAPGDAAALAGALDAALADAGRLAEAGRRARARVLAEFTLQRQAERHLALYRRLLHG